MTRSTNGPEQVSIFRDRATGLTGVIVVDDTTLGPALGGIRWRPYPSEDAAVEECRRLARTMTLKNALAEIPFGGGKSIVVASSSIADRDEALRAFGRYVAQLGGTYIPAADMGTGSRDLEIVGETAPEVSCDDGDPSISTARGVFHAIQAAVRVTGLGSDLSGIRVLVQGAGSVGARLARHLAEANAHVLVSDVDPARVAEVVSAVGARLVAPRDVIGTACDVFAPCAIARVVDDATVGQIEARIIAGAANDVLAHDGLAQTLGDRGITYVPDFVANAGGVVQVHALRDEWSEERLEAALAEIGARTAWILEDAHRTGRTPLEVAHAATRAKLEAHRVHGALT